MNAFIKANLGHDAVRRITVNNAIAARDYDRAEGLCYEKLDPNEGISQYSRPSEWRQLLFDIYDKSVDMEKKIEIARDMLFRFDLKYYAVLKQLFIGKRCAV